MHSPAQYRQTRPAANPAPKAPQTHPLVADAAQAPLVTQLQSLQDQADAQAIQRVKTVSQDYGDVSAAPVGMAIRDSLGPNRDDWTADAIFDAAAGYYADNLERGQALMAQLQQRKDENTPATTGDANAALFEQAYTTSVSPVKNRDHRFNVGTKGGDSDKAAYANSYDVERGSIETATNFANKDPNRAGDGPYLNNSEIFWNQWGAAVDADTPKKFFEFASTNRDRRALKKRALGTITRKAISNTSTILTVQHILPNDVSFTRAQAVNVTYAADTDAFAALLGTPNGRAVGYLLKDHYHEMDLKSFGNVTVDGADTALTFNFAD